MTSDTPFTLEVIRANPKILRLSNPTLAGSAVSLSGASMRFVVKYSVEDADADAVFVKTTSGGGITTTSTTADVTFAVADFAALPYERVVLKYAFTYNNGTAQTVILQGDFIVHPNVNRT